MCGGNLPKGTQPASQVQPPPVLEKVPAVVANTTFTGLQICAPLSGVV